MLTHVCQRWRDRRGVYRPAGEVVNPLDYEIVRVRSVKEPKAFIWRHHYAKTCGSTLRVFELRHRSGELVGVVVYSTVARTFRAPAGTPKEWLTLSRLVLLDNVKANAESMFIGESNRRLAREGFVGLVTFADPVPRQAIDGRVVLVGHVGFVYQATNWIYVGKSKSETKYLLPDGTVYEGRAASKIAAGDRGHRYATRVLLAHGATPIMPNEDPAVWVARERTRVCRPFFHSGNHRYLIALDKRARRHLPAGQPYPKFSLETAA